MKKNFCNGFTLVEMLVVIGIITILVGASIAGFAKMTKSAEKAKAQELVSNVATALTAIFQADGVWPRKLAANGASAGRLDKDTALSIAKKGVFSLNMNDGKTELIGYDRFGIVTPWATAVIKKLGTKATGSSKVANTDATIDNHVLYYALDLDGDGIIEGASVGGESVDVRATAIVWCIGKSGGNNGQPWPYKQGRKRDDVYSWSYGQTQKVK